MKTIGAIVSTLDDFRNILMFSLLLYCVLGSIQILLDNKRGRDVTDRHYQIKVARRFSPILYISTFFAPISWTAKICIVTIAVAVGEGVTYLITYRQKQKKE